MSAPHKLIWWVGGRRGENRNCFFTRMHIKPKFLQGSKPKMTYITRVKNTI